MQRRQGWLFPMMVVAATSVIAFGAVGIAAITGHLVAPPTALHNGNPAAVLTADANAQPQDAKSAGATLDAAAPPHAAHLPEGEGGRPIVRN